MKKWIVRILVAVLVIGALAAAGFVGYRLGFNESVQFSGNRDNAPRGAESAHRGAMPDFQFGFHGRGVQQRGFQMGHGVRSFGFALPLFGLIKIALLGLVLWLAYMFFKGNGWTLSLTRVQPVESLKAETESPKKKTVKKDT